MKKILSMVLVLILTLSMSASVNAEAEETTPKYVFMFIADGQGSPQISATQFYLGTLANPEASVPTPAPLAFTAFPYTGIMTTYDATSFCPDSASSPRTPMDPRINSNIAIASMHSLFFTAPSPLKLTVLNRVSSLPLWNLFRCMHSLPLHCHGLLRTLLY